MPCSLIDIWHLKVMNGGIATSFSTGQEMVPSVGVRCMRKAFTRGNFCALVTKIC